MSKINEEDFNPVIHVKEFKRKCNECKKVWHVLTEREDKVREQIQNNESKRKLAFCSCRSGSVMQAKRNIEANESELDRLQKCPECGSTNYYEEVSIYEKKH